MFSKYLFFYVGFHDVFILVQKDSNVKKKVIDVRTLKIVYQVYHSKLGKEKRNSPFFPVILGPRLKMGLVV
jgi:hypothetical protein